MDPANNRKDFKTLDHQGRLWIPYVRTYERLLLSALVGRIRC